MAKKKISKKRGFSVSDLKGIKIKNLDDLTRFDPKIGLANPQHILEALFQSLKEGDTEAFKEILSAHLEVVNKYHFSRAAGVSRRTLFRMLSPEGNPTLDAVAKVMKSIAKAA